MRVSIDERLARLCAEFSVAKIGEWLERKFASYDTSRADVISISENKNDKEYFKSARLLGFVRDLPDGAIEGRNRPLLVAAVEMRKILTERTSRQAQFNFAKRVLQNAVRSGAAGLNGYPSQGLFFFYDSDRFFRISLVTGEMDGRKFKFNEAKRQSFYINPDRPNNIAKSRLSETISSYADLKGAFSVETLTKEFYGKLFAWYEWAMKPETGVSFPNDDSSPEDGSKYNNESIIRLITRLMFTWFIRQRDMVRKELFTVEGVSALLKDFDAKSMEDDNYYRCILQNLFFATFNCQPEKRGFIKHRGGSFACYSEQHDIKTLYRYEKEFKDAAAFKEIVKRTPFLNCALFDCLDRQQREVDGGKLLLFDGFSDARKRQAHIPNGLFFHPEKGIIPLFDTYEFTIDENNADDADVALDPELLGKVFENLLGAYNPETRDTARNATGSFYTPREIVDYMVEESLKSHIKTKVPQMKDAWLTELFDKTAATEKRELPFDEEVAADIREALYSCKILDPACGSGAFPMGILHCMVRLFSRLDPSNTDLNKRLIMRYKQETNLPPDPLETASDREDRLAALKVQLDEGQHYPDYARKLYLIENCIYGVDIQPIATQISKLRFFISLLCDQLRENWNADGENHGLLSLPNLEAKFVCANTLIALPKTEGELELMSCSKIPKLREKLQQNRHRIFAARTYKQKEKLKARDLEIRDEIRDAVRSTLAKPDKELIKVQQGIIDKLRKDREQYETPKMVKRQKAVQGDFFAATQGELGFEMVDANKPKRDQIDAQIDFAQHKIDSENAKSSASNVTAIDRLATLVAGWDPYDQNAISPFFDPEWMFNINDGFDVVIGNPPYVQLQANGGELAKMYQGCGYETFEKTGDVYCLFYERGAKLLAERGNLCYITSNKWLKIGYGRKLRKMLTDNYNTKLLIDLGGSPVFTSATVDPNILLVGNSSYEHATHCLACKVEMAQFVTTVSHIEDVADYGEDEWIIIPSNHARVLAKMKMNGKELKDWAVEINYGIKTGYNEAYFVDDDIRRTLVKQSPDSAKYIRPIFRGRNIASYYTPPTGWYLLFVPWHFPLHMDSTIQGASKVAEKAFKTRFAALYSYLERFKPELSKRNRAETGIRYEWYSLQRWAADYWKDFSRTKIVYPNMTLHFPFALDETGSFLNDKGFMLISTGDQVNLRYLLGVLNAKTSKLWIWHNCPALGEDRREIRKVYFEHIPIPATTSNLQQPIIALVDRILAAKKKDPEADTSALEAEIDQLVYKLYGLTEEEIAIVEGREEKVKVKGEGEEREVTRRGQARGSAAKGLAVLPDDDEELE